MSDIKDGGPAYPTQEVAGSHYSPGMTLRDHIAAQALTCLGSGIFMETMEVASKRLDKGVDELVAIYVYQIANAMLKERSKE